MMYQGSKRTLGKHIVPCLEATVAPGGTIWEPFCGGCNLTVQVKHRPLVASDINQWLIAMWQALQQGWVPPVELTRDLYQKCKRAPEKHPAELVGYVLACSFRAVFGAGYGGDSQSKACKYGPDGKRNVPTGGMWGRSLRYTHHDAVMRDAAGIGGVDFRHCSYTEIEPKAGDVVYCDPPYAGTSGYAVGKFDSAAFWDWVQRTSRVCPVYTSEQTAPDWITLVWEREHSSKNSQSSVKVERLWVAGLEQVPRFGQQQLW